MPIPVFTIDGILPPFTGAGPGDDSAFMSPYQADALEVAVLFGTGPRRREILGKWLDHRSALRDLGFDAGFQWLDGSFLEEKEPNDLDIVSFFYYPTALSTEIQKISFWNSHLDVFDRQRVRASFLLDAFFIELEGAPETLVSLSRYYLQLFSHQRESYLWKGMVQVPLGNANDDAAREQLLVSLRSDEPEESQA